jgi:succinoglycan biosynthesis transport protein ExoP
MQEKEKQQLNWRDYWEVIARRRWILLGVLFVAGLAGTLGADLWPVRYRSEALILVERQDVPSHYVQPNVTSDVQQRLQAITQQVLSRTRLDRMITQFGLYPKDSKRFGREKLIEKMRDDIDVVPVLTADRNHLTAFRILYTHDNAQTAQQVVNELTSEFINESLRARTQASMATTDFLQTQLNEATKQLASEEAKLRSYKTKYLGELPEQQQTNMQILSSLEAQLYAESNARDRAEQQRIYLESLASAYRGINDHDTSPIASATPLTVIDKTIADLQQQLTALEAKYTPNYPDVVRVRDQLAEWKARRKKAATQAKASPTGASAGNAAPDVSNADMAELQSRLKANAAEIALHKRQVDRLRQQILDAQSRLRLTPLRAQELAQVTRDDHNAREQYQTLLQKKLQSELATNLEKREEGERYRIIDPPSLPQKPVSPNRLEIVLGGWALGLGAGIGLVALEETTDETLRGDADVRALVPCPVLANLPILRSPGQERRRKWARIAEIGGIVLLALASTGLGIFVCLAA